MGAASFGGLRANPAKLVARIEHFYAPPEESAALARGDRGGGVVSLRAGLVGLGAMGRHHARILSELDGVDLVGVVEPAAVSGAAARGARVVRSVPELVALGVDYAVVACPTASHEEVGVELAAAGVCALIEKPLADSAPAAGRLAAAFEDAGLVAGVGHIERYNPALQSLRARLEGGALGEVFQVVTRRQGPFPHRISDVGVVKDLATHDIDLTAWVTGQEYVSVSARTVSKSGRPHEDMVAVVGQLSDGAMVNHLVNWLSPLKERSTVVTGELGCFVADTLTADLTFYANGAWDTEWEALRSLSRPPPPSTGSTRSCMSAERADDRPDAPAGRRPGRRGRIVMLVDNGVEGDSRVQKTARSAAAAGWDVVLLGRAPGRRRVTRRLGGAEVWLIPVPAPLGRRYECRRAPLRNPLAYPPGPLAAYRKRRVKAWRTDLYHRHLALGLAAGRGAGVCRARRALALIRQAALFVPRAYVRALGVWVALRARQTDALSRGRAAMDAPLDRFTTWFWRLAMGERCWRRLDPRLWDLEPAYGRVIDELAPDLIHAHDWRVLGVGARAALRARARGRSVKLVWDAHEFLPGIRPYSDHPRWHPAQCAHEREYAPCADAVVTVSERLADLLVAEYGLPERPAVVLNAPETAGDAPAHGNGPAAGLRERCGIGRRVPLVVYSGAAAPARGLDIMIEALPRLDEVHVALVVPRPTAPYVLELTRRAAELGAGDRVHILPYVPYDQVVPFLSAADVGVIPIHHWPNHEIALITKFFEYSHARLPIVVSDVETMAEVTRSTGQGEVFTAEDVDDYVRAVQAVLADPKRYRAAYDAPGLPERWTWEAQAETLDQIYGRLLRGGPARVPERTAT